MALRNGWNVLRAFVVSGVALLGAAIVTPAAAGCAVWDLSGDWQIDTPKGNFNIVITQDGSTLRGESVGGSPSVIEGRIVGNATNLTVHAVGNPMQGRIYEGTISDSGQWDGWFHGIDDPENRWSWVGIRAARCLQEGTAASTGPVARTVVEARMTGQFDTSFGLLDLTIDGGTYTFGDGRVFASRINGMTMDGIWQQTTGDRACEDGSFHGKFRFDFTDTGFTGVYGYCDEEPSIPGWDGTKRWWLRGESVGLAPHGL